jgi:N-glycosylase/DNA lyase
MHDIHIDEPFHLDHTLGSGQVFRWRNPGNVWEGIVQGEFIRISQDTCISCSCDEDFLTTYFRLDDDLDKILSFIDKDKYIHEAITALYGMRLVRQPPWECLISFICSSFNNVPRIKLIVENLSRKFGTRILHGYAFPTAEALASASLKTLRKCGLGYRDKYILETARIVASGLDLERLRTKPYEEAKDILLELPGVGHKVADCVCLFSLDKLEAFPCDVNIQNCITRYYGPCSNIRVFGQQYFGKYAGYANHYLFHYHRLYNKR